MVPRGRRPPPPPNANTHKVVVLIVYVQLARTVWYQFNTSTNKDLFEDTEQLSFVFFFEEQEKKERGTRQNNKSSRNNNSTKNRRAKTTDSFAPLLSKKSIEKARCGARRERDE